MASLTDYIPGVSSGRGATPATPASNTLGNIFDVASKFVGAEGDRKERAWQDEQRSAWREDRADKLEADKARDAAVGAAFDFERQIMNPPPVEAADGQPPPIDASLEGVGAVNTEVVGLNKMRLAEEQGRVPAGTASIKFEDVVARLYKDFPDQRYEIAVTFQGLGYNSYLFREEKARAGEAAALSKSQFELEEIVLKQGAERGWLIPGEDRQKAVERLSLALGKEHVAEQGYKALEARAKALELKIKEGDYARKEAQPEIVAMVVGPSMDKVNLRLNQMGSLYIAADGDVMKEKMLFEAAQAMRVEFRANRSVVEKRLRESRADDETFKLAMQQFDDAERVLDDFFTGKLSNVQQFKNTSEMLNTQMGLTFQQQAPVFAYLSKTFGTQTTLDLMQGIVELNPKIRDQVAAEIKGLNGPDPERNQVTLANIVSLLKGEKGLPDMNRKEAQEALSGAVKILPPAAQRISKGEADAGTVTSFKNVVMQATNAVVEIQPGTATLNDVRTAQQVLFNSDTIKAFRALSGDPDMEPVIFGVRGAAVQNLQNANVVGPKKVASQPDKDRFGNKIMFGSESKPWQYVYWDKANDRYAIRNDRGLFDEYQKKATSTALASAIGVNGETGLMSWDTAIKRDQQLYDKMEALNGSVDFLIATKDSDPKVKGLADTGMLRRHYALGEPLRKPTGEVIATDSLPDFQKQVDDLKADVLGDIQQYATDPELSLSRPSADVVFEQGLIPQESGGQPGIEGPETKYGRAYGLAQVLDGTGEQMAAKLGIAWEPQRMRGKSPADAEYQKMIGRAYFEEGLQKYGGDYRKALMYYHGGPDQKNWGPKTRKYASEVLERVNYNY